MQESFLATLKARFQPKSGLLAKHRQKAFDLLSLPGRKTEGFRDIALNALYDSKLEAGPSSARKSMGKLSIVLENGVFKAEKSQLASLPKGVQVLDLEKAFATYSALLTERFTTRLQKRLDPFAALNQAFFESGLFIYVGPNVEVEDLHILSTGSGFFSPRMHIVLSQNSSLSMSTTLSSDGGLQNAFIDVLVSEKAKFHNSVQTEKTGHNLATFQADLKKEAVCEIVSVNQGADLLRQNFDVALLGSNSHVELSGCSFVRGAMQAHTHVVVSHEAPDCISHQLFKNILEDSSHTSFDGTIFVEPIAQKTEAYQLNNNMLLSEQAIADSRPNLEIFADDVKATHGATFGQVDVEQLLYMQSRGISKAEAAQLLLDGFVREVTDRISSPAMQAVARELLQ